MDVILFLLLALCCVLRNCDAFVNSERRKSAPCITCGIFNRQQQQPTPNHLKYTKGIGRSSTSIFNIYDDWRSDAVVDTMHLDEENALQCLNECINSDYGTTMFGCHDLAASIGITGAIKLVEVSGPEVYLELEGEFWHRRSTVLGRIAMYLNARMPEITDVLVCDQEELADFEEIRDKISGDVIFRRDKRSDDFNGDRATMEYQGIDPDMRGPFPQSAMGAGGLTINPM